MSLHYEDIDSDIEIVEGLKLFVHPLDEGWDMETYMKYPIGPSGKVNSKINIGPQNKYIQ
jgi:hypothetical protein